MALWMHINPDKMLVIRQQKIGKVNKSKNEQKNMLKTG